MKYDVVVVGGGIAGLTSTAFLVKNGCKVLLCEKENTVGGLVNSFKYKGFTFDVGIRAIENSGVLTPMLRQLGIDIEFLENNVSVGIEDSIIKVTSKDSVNDYKDLLSNKFPNNKKEIEKIRDEINKMIDYMDVLYGRDNPIFLDMKEDSEYLLKTTLPSMYKFIPTIYKIGKLNTPVDEYLQKFTNNQSLIDMISQPFFTKTPTFFALSYFSLYLDYKYPKGGTGTFIDKIEKYILDNNGEIKKETEISKINSEDKFVTDINGNKYNYNKLIWASDLKRLYNNVDLESIKDKKVKKNIINMKEEMLDKTGGDSIFSLYITLDLDKKYFENICTEHFFYTPCKKGITNINMDENLMASSEKHDIINWMKKYYELTTYEISIPVMRDSTLAPKGKTGLIINTFIDYSVVKRIKEMGWYEEFKKLSEEYIINTLETTVFHGFKDKVMDKFSYTPLTIERLTGNTDGAITGWAFTNSKIPVESKMANIIKTPNTVIPDVYKAGQWSFSPTGLPVSIMTGKLAADKCKK